MDAKSFLAMEQTGEDTWGFEVSERVITPGNFLFGGCGLASGLVALEEASGRPTIWATAQYLSYAPLGATVQVKTNLAVVGGRVTQARATTYAEGREILTVTGAFGTGDISSPAPWVTMPDVPAPEQCPPRVLPEYFNRSIFNHLETRIALGRSFTEAHDAPSSAISALWSRV
ncbi:MAG: acyl-CoA thioesterase domain-containing protein, partial [Acidimicrobiales bacterium]